MVGAELVSSTTFAFLGSKNFLAEILLTFTLMCAAIVLISFFLTRLLRLIIK